MPSATPRPTAVQAPQTSFTEALLHDQRTYQPEPEWGNLGAPTDGGVVHRSVPDIPEGQEEQRNAIYSMVHSEASRAGLIGRQDGNGLSQSDIEDITRRLYWNKPDETTHWFRSVMRLGRTMDLDDNTLDPVIGADGQGVPRPSEEEDPTGFFGEVWDNQRRDWDGYGWTNEKVAKLGRQPESYELSPGGREAWRGKGNEKLVNDLLNQKEQQEDSRRTTASISARLLGRSFGDKRPASAAVSGISRAAARPPENGRHYPVGDAVARWQKEQDRTHGEGGYMGLITNPGENTLAAAMNSMQFFSDATWNSVNSKQGQWLTDRLLAAAASAGGGEYKPRPYHELVGTETPFGDAANSWEARKWLSIGGEPLIPSGSTPAEGHGEIAGMSAAPPTFDQEYNRATGEWPSYFGSGLATFANGFFDPSIVVAPAVRKGLLSAGQWALSQSLLKPTTMTARATTGIGRYLVDKNLSAKGSLLPLVLREAGEELPASAALQGALLASATSGQSPGDYGKQPTHSSWSDMFEPGNRPDLMQVLPELDSSQRSPGQEPKYGYRMPTAGENKKSYEDTLAAAAAMRQGFPDIAAGMKETREAYLKPPAEPLPKRWLW